MTNDNYAARSVIGLNPQENWYGQIGNH